MADALKELLVAYSSGGSDADMEETAQSKSCGSSDNENCSNDDVIAEEVVSASKKPTPRLQSLCLSLSLSVCLSES